MHIAMCYWKFDELRYRIQSYDILGLIVRRALVSRIFPTRSGGLYLSFNRVVILFLPFRLVKSTRLNQILQFVHCTLIQSPCFNSSLPDQNGRPCAEEIFKYIFMNEKCCISIWISLKFAPKRLIDNKSALQFYGSGNGLVAKGTIVQWYLSESVTKYFNKWQRNGEKSYIYLCVCVWSVSIWNGATSYNNVFPPFNNFPSIIFIPSKCYYN